MMINRKSSLPIHFCCVLALLLVSCAGQEDRLATLPEKFTTHIYDNGLKQFQFQLIDDHSTKGTHSGAYGESSHRGNGDNGNSEATSKRREGREKQITAEMVKRLEIKLQAVGYCRGGYILYEEFSTISLGDLLLKGECKEGATDADKTAFPNVCTSHC